MSIPMQNTLLLMCVMLCAHLATAQDSLNMTLLARWDDDSLPIASPGNLNTQYSGCWGMALDGREYAIIGGARHVLVFDVTDPTQPRRIAQFEGQTNTVWREFKSYQGRFYAVSDATNEGMMILDMRQAPDTVIRTYYSNTLFSRSHTITLDTTSGRIYLNGTNVQGNGLVILDVKTNPDNPTLLSRINLDANGAGGYVHDSYVRHDTIYASSGFEGLYILDCTNPDTCLPLAQYETGGYNHNAWLSADGRHLYYTEEIPEGRPVQIVAVDDLAEGIRGVGRFLDNLLNPGDSLPKAIPHNVYIRDNLLFNSQYEDGLLVYDLTDPEKPVLIAYYDTHPQNTQYNTYFGCWGNYPWLPSGTIIASDMQNGLQLLRLTNSSAQHPTMQATLAVSVTPNPAAHTVRIRLTDAAAGSNALLSAFDALGRLKTRRNIPDGTTLELDLADWPGGAYFLWIQNDQGASVTRTLIVEH